MTLSSSCIQRLADDMMEPYRPFVDQYVFGNPDVFAGEAGSLTKEMRRGLLSALTCDVRAGGVRRPLSIALAFSTASLAKYYLDKAEALVLPEFSE